MNFKIKKISHATKSRNERSEPSNNSILTDLKEKHFGKKYKLSFGILGSALIIILLITGIVKAVSSIDFKFFLKIAGDELQKDAYEHTNFLILGTGGKNHEGADLTDTIIVASLDEDDKLITMVSIPRDIYVKDMTVGNSKINEVYYNAQKYYKNSIEGIEHMKEKVEELMGIPIHYWVKVDFDGFKDLVDALGGIDINVKKPIYDPYYPKDGTFLYEPFSISAGEQHMDGEIALKYARSRKTTSDFDRADRQQQIIYAIKEKALQTKTILNQNKIIEILDTLKENISTNISVKELLTLGGMATDYSSDRIQHKLIHDDPTQCGGFLYTPERQFYNEMFVLLPAGGFDFVHLYSDLNFNFQKIATENSRIHILNGTKRGGVAGETKQVLKRFCFDIVRFGNAEEQNITQTTYYYQQKQNEDGKITDSRPEALNFLQKLIPGRESTQIPQKYFEAGYFNQADIIIEMGSDYVNSKNYLEDPFSYLPVITQTPTTTSDNASVADDQTKSSAITNTTNSEPSPTP